MEIDSNQLINDVLKLEVAHAGIISVNKIKFSQDLRNLCKQNACGKYNTNWMCPPGIGELDELKAKVMAFDKGLVVQTIFELEDSFDFEGMMDAKKTHGKILRNIVELINTDYKITRLLPLSIGECDLCSECTYIKKEDCRFPDKAVSSVEAYGINVGALTRSCKIPYTNGKDTVSYVGLILY